MATVERITEAEILDALTAALPGAGPEDAQTQEEIARAVGINVKKVRAAMRVLQAQGRLVTHRVMRQRMTGHAAPVTVFTILPAKKKK